MLVSPPVSQVFIWFREVKYEPRFPSFFHLYLELQYGLREGTNNKEISKKFQDYFRKDEDKVPSGVPIC